MGNERLYDIMKEKDAIYMKEDFSDEDGIRASELEAEFADMDGWNAESDAATLLNGLGIPTEDHYTQMADLPGAAKVKVLLAQALFGNPDILLLDEPTNHLDLDAIAWLEEFLINFENTVIVVSHDRYFLNKVCTNIADMDYGKIQLYAGNYDFWYESSQLLVRQMKEANKKKEEKIKELQEFISRFSANASKSKQATSRKRALEKIQLDDIRPSSRKYPYIDFRPNREIGNEVLTVDGISKTIDGVKVLDNISFIVGHDDKIAFVGGNELAKTTLFKILAGEMEPDEGSYKWGVTTSQSYFPKDNTAIFDSDELIVDWLTQYSEIKDATYVRGFLGRMLFAGEDGVKKMRVLSGGEKVRVLLSRMMIMGSNVLIFDEPTAVLTPQEIESLLLTKKDMINKQLGDLNLMKNFGCTVTRIRRSGIDLSPSPDLALKFGDKLMVVGEKDGIKGVARLLGNDTKQLSDTDFFPIALGIVLGVLFGKLNISFSDSLSFSPGLTGGILMVALFLSAIGKTGPILWSMSGPANQLLRQLGLLLFLAEVGTSAGRNLMATFQESGWLLFGVGAAITLVPMLVAVCVGLFVFKINILDLLGTITGGMTSTPGLAAADSMTDSNIPSVAYATVYPIAMVFLILIIQVIASAVY